MILYRPVGLGELRLIAESGFAGFPPRLEWQPIFYPVLNRAYAQQIARDWNTSDEASGFCGFVTTWESDDGFVRQYSVRTVGGTQHQELWVPSEALPEFNAHIVGLITVIDQYYGPKFKGAIDAMTRLPLGLAS